MMKIQSILSVAVAVTFCFLPLNASAADSAKATKKVANIDWKAPLGLKNPAASQRGTNGWITGLKRNDCRGISLVTAGKCMDGRCYSSCQTGKCKGIARGESQSCSGDGVCKGVAKVIKLLGECYNAYDRKKKKQGNKFDRRAEDKKLRQCDSKARSNAKSYCTGPYVRLCRAWVTGDSGYCKSGDRDCKGVVRKDRSYCESNNCKAIARGDRSYCR